MVGRGRPRALQLDWLTTFLFVGTALLAFYRAGILGVYISNLAVAALLVGLLYTFFRKRFSVFGPLTGYVYVFIGLFAFYIGSYSGTGAFLTGLFRPITGPSQNLVPLDVSGFVSGTSSEVISPVLPVILAALFVFLLAYHFNYTSFEGF